MPASIAKIRSLVASLNHRNTIAACVLAVAARCTDRAPGRRRCAVSHRVTAFKVASGTSRLAR